jgi:hypothetical protein
MEPGEPRRLAGSFWRLDGILELNHLVLPLFALAVVGMIGIVRDAYRAGEDPAGQHRGLLFVWITVALFGWTISGGADGSPGPGVDDWKTFLTVPVVMAAALGVIEIAERRVGFILSLSIGLVALADTAFLAGRSTAHSMAEDVSLGLPGQFVDGGLSHMALGLALILAAGGFVLARFAREHDARQRIVLTGMLLQTVCGAPWLSAARAAAISSSKTSARDSHG